MFLLFLIPSFSSASVTTTYTYNALNRLSTADYGSTFTETYTYDPNGNRISLAVSTGGGSGCDNLKLTHLTGK